MNERAPQPEPKPKSFWENLKAAPKDVARELKQGFEKLVTRKGEQGPILTEAAEAQLKQSNELWATVARKEAADRAAQDQARQEIDDLFSAPSPAERGARYIDRPAPQSETKRVA